MPSFSIEVPGEANPLTETTLLHALETAQSRNSQQITVASKQLQEWERYPEFYRLVSTAFISSQLPRHVRFLAIITLKNGIDKYWRKSANNAINVNDKAIIRRQLFEIGIAEIDDQLAKQNALAIAKIARLDYPNDWPDLISTLLQRVREHSSDEKSPHLFGRVVTILLHVIKELSTARIQRSRTYLVAATPEILGTLGSYYFQIVSEWQSKASDETTPLFLLLASRSFLILRTLRRLIIAGYDFPNRDTNVAEFWKLTIAQMSQWGELISELRSHAEGSVLQLIRLHHLQLAKLHVNMAEQHSAAFALLPDTTQLVKSHWQQIKLYSSRYVGEQTDDGEGDKKESLFDLTSIEEKASLVGIQIIRACIKMAFMPVHTFHSRNEQEKTERAKAEGLMKQHLLTADFVQDLFTIAITRFMVLRNGDIALWSIDAEDWMTLQDTEDEDVTLSIRGCSERLVLDLMTHFKAFLINPMMSFLAAAADSTNENDVMSKDAIYSALGMSAAILREQIDFDSLFQNVLIAEVQKPIKHYAVLRRRIAILAGQWVIVKASVETRRLVYQMFDHLLNPEDTCNELIVRITAGKHFKHVASDFEFDADGFSPYAESVISRLMLLIETVEQTSTKMSLLDTISVLIERFDHRISPFAERIVNILPSLWKQTGEEHLMKQSILTLLARLTNALKGDSTRFSPMLIPIIDSIVQTGSPLQLYLLEETLDLWHSLLIQSASPISPELLTLAKYIIPLLQDNSEYVRETLEILESYVLITPSSMLDDSSRKDLVLQLKDLIGPKVRPEINGLSCNIIEKLIDYAHSLGGKEGVIQLTHDMMEAGLLQKQLEGLRTSWEAHCTTGPLAKSPDIDGVVETDYFSVFARICFYSTSSFMTFLTGTTIYGDDVNNKGGATVEIPRDTNVKWLVEEWFSHFENIGDPSRRKLMCLALTKLLETSHSDVFASFQLLMSMWTDVITELTDQEPTEEDSRTIGVDSLVYTDPLGLRQVAEGYPEAAEDERKRMLSFNDPVHRISLPEFVRDMIHNLIQTIGGEEKFRNEILINVDKDVIAAFAKLGIM